MSDEIVQYYVVNEELNMSPGKLAAQIAHAATWMALDLASPVSSKFPEFHDYFKQWFREGMKKVVLRGNQQQLERLIQHDFYHIQDSGLTEVPRGALTVVGLPPMPKDIAQDYVKQLRLY
ncbi:peptidyl-tRNA hydrolase [Xylanibacillus composti]|uniref:peptidyl-tRNA hydrolase n=1 Tax=Xylanibacillus composti TaxID=1572762 RepID=A0A8J4M190_9BACL|nr:aminoacyl-tRNA hydrolase [Xylanibacillus composti]MDT9724201.1 peptidyl-tRNA hydrolase [Xylanibacillus composti]GIQ68284.1 peptidyl-tRNA hydrolase [Xylanibacillus composti]